MAPSVPIAGRNPQEAASFGTVLPRLHLFTAVETKANALLSHLITILVMILLALTDPDQNVKPYQMYRELHPSP